MAFGDYTKYPYQVQVKEQDTESGTPTRNARYYDLYGYWTRADALEGMRILKRDNPNSIYRVREV